MKIKLALSICLFGGIMSTANAQTDKIIYRSVFDIKNAFCSIKTNGVVGQDNRSDAGIGRGFGTGSTSAMLFMENGENEISVEIASTNWFDEKLTNEHDKNRFDKDAYCNLNLIKYKKNKSENISNIRISVNDNNPTSITSTIEPQYSSINGVIDNKISTAFKVTPGFIHYKDYDPSWYPDGMKLYEFSRKVTVDGLPEWSWINATPYTDTPEQRKLLQEAYQELWQALDSKDISKIKKLMAISLHAFSYITNSSEDEILQDRAFYNDIKDKEFKMIPINWEAYDVKVMNKGRMIRLINKSDPDFSPVSYSYSNDGYATTAPIFSLINGHFRIVL
ncbi:hypothetical protein FHU10_0224 [Serratia fonticola]|uniref:Uncharacterized protein n=1 Tax=Serratia fonticola TaxID=47917 RepID=A0A559SZQ9_SERFO|nr:hypothetical protein [Serratia fonticola]TQI79677.1 hypothetical protein FHU09_2225 [Serratia fonticola]TQI98297.1 hypothetical protein FHU11_3822 [Serratia fonticola]TVZ67825.1 hypothetical protein FHU10_0224 [Serratia fonticola]